MKRNPAPKVRSRNPASRSGFLGICIAATAFMATIPNASATPPSHFQVDPNKLTLCSITVNSTEERETFKSRLDPRDFNFVELLPEKNATYRGTGTDRPMFNGDRSDWFKDACASGIQCDALVVSGHFGGTFFGVSEFTLSLDELEKRSCSRDCAGILNHPQEVFLFGCNTLAPKEPDHRSHEQYLSVLMRDGLSPRDARQVAEFRYGSLGQSYENRMRRVFGSVPHIYGFDSVGPSGKSIQPMLDRYLREKGNYADHLLKIAVQRTSEGLENLNGRTNPDLARALKATRYSHCQGIDLENPQDEIKRNLCNLRDEARSLESRLTLARILIESPDDLVYLPAIRSLVKSASDRPMSSAARSALDTIRNLREPKKRLIARIARIKHPLEKIEMAQTARELGWYSRAETDRILRDALKHLMKPPMSVDSANLLCSLIADDSAIDDRSGRAVTPTWAHVTSKDVARPLLGTEAGLRALNCVNSDDETLHRRLAGVLRSRYSGIRSYAFQALGRWRARSSGVIQSMTRALRTEPTERVRADAIAAFLETRLDPLPASTAEVVASIAASSRDPSLIATAMRVLDGAGSLTPKTRALLRQLAKKPKASFAVPAIAALARQRALTESERASWIQRITHGSLDEFCGSAEAVGRDDYLAAEALGMLLEHAGPYSEREQQEIVRRMKNSCGGNGRIESRMAQAFSRNPVQSPDLLREIYSGVVTRDSDGKYRVSYGALEAGGTTSVSASIHLRILSKEIHFLENATHLPKEVRELALRELRSVMGRIQTQF